MRHRILALFLALCIFCGVALAGFGGSEETEPFEDTNDSEELPPVGGLGGVDGAQVDSGMWTSDMEIGPGSYDQSMPVSPLDGSPEGFDGLETSAMYPWAPSQEAFSPQPAVSPIGGYTTSYESTVGAYYTTVAPPASEQRALISYNVATAPPAAVYYQGTYVPWSSFAVTFPKTNPTFWVSTYSGWSLYAVCPMHGWVRELMYIPRTGTLKVYEIYPSGQTKMYNYGWATTGYKYIWFYGDTPGRHIAIFTVSDNPSNAVTVDVV